jgi:hypothetical protein
MLRPVAVMMMSASSLAPLERTMPSATTSAMVSVTMEARPLLKLLK